ncbi:hypothetical protein [Stutzerimonas stutzeri]|uniref:hypothetical protein n=1 Tax=Stutzerimonas stutzeri TaxID=316 RepID=UPI00210C0C99|nr:hypothetical protein [Stutzerimonas stutzeri]MCQ4322532.1 hypothetical protein [Stutzerimonas stutzeri]
MQHPRFALRAVRKRGKSITGLALCRDMLGPFLSGFRTAEALPSPRVVCPVPAHLILAGGAALKGLWLLYAASPAGQVHVWKYRHGGSNIQLSSRLAI